MVVSIATIAFIAEVFSSILQQWAFIMQKLAHRHVEQ